MNNVVTTLAPSFLIGSSAFLQATRKPIISQMGSKFGKIGPGTYELAVLERLEKSQYEGCSNMNASSFITFFTYMLRYIDKVACRKKII